MLAMACAFFGVPYLGWLGREPVGWSRHRERLGKEDKRTEQPKKRHSEAIFRDGLQPRRLSAPLPLRSKLNVPASQDVASQTARYPEIYIVASWREKGGERV